MIVIYLIVISGLIYFLASFKLCKDKPQYALEEIIKN